MKSELSPADRAQNFERFRTLVAEDLPLLESFRQAANPEDFSRAVVLRGAERGLVFTENEVRAALHAARRTWVERDCG